MKVEAEGHPSTKAKAELAETSPAVSGVVLLPLHALEPDPFQPRSTMRPETIQALADSIRQHGLLQPLLVRPRQGPGSKDRYWIVAGERRFRAAESLGLPSLPCRVHAFQHEDAAIVALAENVHREDLSEIDKAEALLRIKSFTDRTWDDVAELVQLSRDYVKRLAGLLKLEESVKAKVRTGEISARTAIALRPLPPKRQVEMAERVLREHLTAEQVRAEILQKKAELPARKRGAAQDEPERPTGRGAGLVGTLEHQRDKLQELERWLGERDWTPSRLGPRQHQALLELADAASLLQQRLRAIRSSVLQETLAAYTADEDPD